MASGMIGDDFGAYIEGKIFDLTSQYHLAFFTDLALLD